MNISKFTQKSLEAVQNTEKLAYEYGNQQIDQEHLLYSLLTVEDSLIFKLITKMGISGDQFRDEVQQAIGKLPKVSGGQVYFSNDANKVLVENANSETGSFALLFEFDGDIRKIRHVLYNCSASRPTIESKTNEEDKEVQTETLTIKARPMADGYVKAKTGDSTTETVYNNWYKSVYLPAASTAEQQSVKSTKSVS